MAEAILNIAWLVALITVLILAMYWLKFKPVPVMAHTVARVRTDEARVKAVLRQARVQQNRLAELVSGKAASQEELDKATETLHIAEADLKRSQSVIVEARSQTVNAERNLQLRREQLAFTELRSPYEGLVVRRDRDPGGVVVPSSAILQLIDIKEIWISLPFRPGVGRFVL